MDAINANQFAFNAHYFRRVDRPKNSLYSSGLDTRDYIVAVVTTTRQMLTASRGEPENACTKTINIFDDS